MTTLMQSTKADTRKVHKASYKVYRCGRGLYRVVTNEVSAYIYTVGTGSRRRYYCDSSGIVFETLRDAILNTLTGDIL